MNQTTTPAPFTRTEINAITSLADIERKIGGDDGADRNREYILQSIAAYLAEFNPLTVEDVRACTDLVTRLLPGDPGPFDYEGYMTVVCGAPEKFAYHCIVHFIGEGLEAVEAEAYMQRVMGLFREAYPV